MNRKKIKIIYGIPSFSIGGIENQLSLHLKIFDKEKYELHLVTLFEFTSRLNYLERLPDHISVHQLNFKGYFDLPNLYKLFLIIRKVKPDIVVSSMFSANAVFRFFKLFFWYKSITREHNTYTDRSFFHRLGEKILSFLSDAIVAVSRDVATYYAKQNFVDPSRVQVINNGIDLNSIKKYVDTADVKEIRNKLKLTDEQRVIINVARLKKQKNQEMLIRVFSELIKINNNYLLYILGDGQERANLEKLIRDEGLIGKVELLGFRKDVYDYYLISDFFVLSSRIEGFPNVFLEAMTFGLPVVTTKVPGANEIVVDGYNGFIVADEKELLLKMLLMVDLPKEKREELASNCQKSVERFDLKYIVEQYENLFNDILKI